MNGYLFYMMLILFGLFFIEFIYKKIILPLLMLKYLNQHDRLRAELSLFLRTKGGLSKEDEQAKDILLKLLDSHSTMIQYDNFKRRVRFAYRMSHSNEDKIKFKEQITRNKKILESTSITEFQDFFEKSVNIVKISFIFNSLIDFLLLALVFIVFVPIIILIGFLGRGQKYMSSIRQLERNNYDIEAPEKLCPHTIS